MAIGRFRSANSRYHPIQSFRLPGRTGSARDRIGCEHVLCGKSGKRDSARCASDYRSGEKGHVPRGGLKLVSTPILMPALSPTMKEGKITKWLKKEGDKISSGEAVAEVETDKSNLEVEAYEDGYLLKGVVPENESARVGAPIANLGEKGEKVEVPAQQPKPVAAAPAPAAPAPRPSTPAPAADLAPAAAQKTSPPGPAAPRSHAGPAQVLPVGGEADSSEAEGRLL